MYWTVGVKLGEKHSFYDFGLIMTGFDVSAPVPQTKMVSVPGRSGDLDYSEVVTGGIRYLPRTVTIKFFCEDDINTWTQRVSEIRNEIAGRRLKIIVDNDKAFYWYGRITDVSQSINNRHSEIIVKATVNPFKYSIEISETEVLMGSQNPTAEELSRYSDIKIDEYKIVNVECTKVLDNIIVVSDADMVLTVGSREYDICIGSQVVYCELAEGENLLSFVGNGCVDINIFGGSL